METNAKATRRPTVVGVLTAPLVWVERAKGRRRLALLALYGLILAVLAMFGYRASRLAGYPDIGDPFDPAPIRAIDVPPDRNAWSLWREAEKRLKRSDEIDRILVRGRGPMASPPLLAYLDQNAEALDLWRQGTDRPDAMPARPGTEENIAPYQRGSSHHRMASLALLQGDRLLAGGDPSGAWTWYRAALRGSRLVGRHASSFEAYSGVETFAIAAERATKWAANPLVGPELIRKALGDVRSLDALGPSPVECLQIDYLAEQKEWSRPGLMSEYLGSQAADEDWPSHLPGYLRLLAFLQNEPERAGASTRSCSPTGWPMWTTRPRPGRSSFPLGRASRSTKPPRPACPPGSPPRPRSSGAWTRVGAPGSSARAMAPSAGTAPTAGSIATRV